MKVKADKKDNDEQERVREKQNWTKQKSIKIREEKVENDEGK